MSTCNVPQGGFSFDGVDIATLGLTYAPESKNFYVFAPAQKNIYSQSYEGHPGEYMYGSNWKPKEFNLRCIFEKEVEQGLLHQVFNVFQEGKTARLVFTRRPWVYYVATVIKVDLSGLLTAHSGAIQIQLRASFPFGRSEIKTLTDADQYPNILENSGYLLGHDFSAYEEAWLNAQLQYGTEVCYIYNPGDVATPVSIEFAGECEKRFSLVNSANNTSVSFIGITKALTTDAGKWIVSDGINGKTILTNGTKSELAHLYHYNGFISLEPGQPERNISLRFTTSGTCISTDYIFTDRSIGKCICSYDAGVYKLFPIISIIDEHTVEFNQWFPPKPSYYDDYNGWNVTSKICDIITVNRISVGANVSAPTFTRFKMNYTPLFY